MSGPQSVTPNLSAGGEFFWLQSNLKSGVGLAMRHTGEKHVGTLQVGRGASIWTACLTNGSASSACLGIRGLKIRTATVAHRPRGGCFVFSSPLCFYRLSLKVATTGIMSMGYAHKVSEKITLASDFLWHWQSREASATVGFDCMLRQCRYAVAARPGCIMCPFRPGCTMFPFRPGCTMCPFRPGCTMCPFYPGCIMCPFRPGCTMCPFCPGCTMCPFRPGPMSSSLPRPSSIQAPRQDRHQRSCFDLRRGAFRPGDQLCAVRGDRSPSWEP